MVPCGALSFPFPYASPTDQSSVGSEAQGCRVFHTAAGRQRTWQAVVKEISQSGPGNKTTNNSDTHQTQEVGRKPGSGF